MRIEQRVPLPVAAIDLVSHELLSPVTVMSGVVEVLHSRLPELSEAQRDDLLDSMRRQLTLLTAIIGRISSLSDLEHQQVELDLRPVDVATVVRALIGDLNGHGPSSSVIRVDATGPTMAVADITALQEIMLNLMTNALRYGAGEPIVVTVAGRDDVVETRVRDRGPGVSAIDRDQIFEPYVRGASQSPGLGIGLALGRGLAEAQGGTLRHRPPPTGDGSVFVLSLPRADPGA